MNTLSTIQEQAAQIDAGAEALRQRLQGGKTLRPWPQIPNSSKKKWREYATVVLAAAAIPLPKQTKEEESWRTMESAPMGEFVLVANPKLGPLPVVAKRYPDGWHQTDLDGRIPEPTLWTRFASLPPASSIPSKKEDGNG